MSKKEKIKAVLLDINLAVFTYLATTMLLTAARSPEMFSSTSQIGYLLVENIFVVCAVITFKKICSIGQWKIVFDSKKWELVPSRSNEAVQENGDLLVSLYFEKKRRDKNENQ